MAIEATITCNITGTSLVVTAVVSGSVSIGQTLFCNNIDYGIKITASAGDGINYTLNRAPIFGSGSGLTVYLSTVTNSSGTQNLNTNNFRTSKSVNNSIIAYFNKTTVSSLSKGAVVSLQSNNQINRTYVRPTNPIFTSNTLPKIIFSIPTAKVANNRLLSGNNNNRTFYYSTQTTLRLGRVLTYSYTPLANIVVVSKSTSNSKNLSYGNTQFRSISFKKDITNYFSPNKTKYINPSFGNTLFLTNNKPVSILPFKFKPYIISYSITRPATSRPLSANAFNISWYEASNTVMAVSVPVATLAITGGSRTLVGGGSASTQIWSIGT